MAFIINDTVMSGIVRDILNELESSKAKHPYYPTDPLRQSAITLEEALEALVEMVNRAVEVQRTALHVGRLGNEDKRRGMDHLRKELIQTAAMCVKQLEAMARDHTEERKE